MTVKDCQHVVLDAGHISVESSLADQSTLDAVKAKEREEYGEEDYKRLESLMYDRFYVKLEDAQVRLPPSPLPRPPPALPLAASPFPPRDRA